eukprot:Colp12_sorted_trinity150504_noHs@2083
MLDTKRGQHLLSLNALHSPHKSQPSQQSQQSLQVPQIRLGKAGQASQSAPDLNLLTTVALSDKPKKSTLKDRLTSTAQPTTHTNLLGASPAVSFTNMRGGGSTRTLPVAVQPPRIECEFSEDVDPLPYFGGPPRKSIFERLDAMPLFNPSDFANDVSCASSFQNVNPAIQVSSSNVSPLMKAVALLENIRGVSEDVATVIETVVQVLLTPQNDVVVTDAITTDADFKEFLENYGATRRRSTIDGHSMESGRRRARPRSVVNLTDDSQGLDDDAPKRLSQLAQMTPTELFRLQSLDSGVDVSLEVQRVMAKVNSWHGFDIFELQRASGGHALLSMGKFLFYEYNISSAFNIDDEVLHNWLAAVEAGYRDLPYHNSTHGADVAHGVHLFLHHRLHRDLGDEEMFALLVAALVHDLDHPGRTNAFMIESRHELATLYNDISVLESHHVAQAFRMTSRGLKGASCDIFARLDHESFKRVRSLVVQLVLATDIAYHFSTLTLMKRKTEEGIMDLRLDEDRLLLMKCAVKAADLSNPAKVPPIARRWTKCIMEEFYSQGDEEKAQGRPASKFMDRNAPDVAKCQLGFINYLVAPLYETVARWEFDGISGESLLENINANREFWQQAENMLTSLEIDRILHEADGSLPRKPALIKEEEETTRDSRAGLLSSSLTVAAPARPSASGKSSGSGPLLLGPPIPKKNNLMIPSGPH